MRKETLKTAVITMLAVVAVAVCALAWSLTAELAVVRARLAVKPIQVAPLCQACRCPAPPACPVPGKPGGKPSQPAIPPSLVLDLMRDCEAGRLDFSTPDFAIRRSSP